MILIRADNNDGAVSQLLLYDNGYHGLCDCSQPQYESLLGLLTLMIMLPYFNQQSSMYQR